VEERGWAYRRRPPEGTVLYEAVKDNLATRLAEASEVGRGLPRYVERDVSPVRRRARRHGLRGGQVGAVSFIPFFGSALQVTPHFHSLVPDGVFVPREGGVRIEPLPPPTQAEVKRLLRVVRHRVLRLLEKRGALPAQGPEDALQTFQAHSLQRATTRASPAWASSTRGSTRAPTFSAPSGM